MRTAIARSINSVFDPRTQSIKRAFIDLGLECLIFDWSPEISTAPVSRFSKQRNFSIGLRQLLPNLKFNYWLLRSLSQWQPQLIVCVDIDTFIGAILYKFFSIMKKRKVILILDVADSIASKFTNRHLKVILIQIEKTSMLFADFVVFPSINRVPLPHKINIRVIENVFLEPATTIELRKLSKNKNSIYYGGLLLKDRGIDKLLTLAQDSNIKIEIAGYGEMEESVRKAAQNYSNIKFHGKVEFQELSGLRAQSAFSWCWYDQSSIENQNHASGKILESLLVGSVPLTNVNRESLPTWYPELGTDILFVNEVNFRWKILSYENTNIRDLNPTAVKTTQKQYLELLAEIYG